MIELSLNNDMLRFLSFCPVTLITTVGKDGSINAAPHSRSTMASYNPLQIIISVNVEHDTCRNIVETGEFVINILSVDLIKQIWITQKHFPYGINELEQAGLTAFPAEKVKPPRIKECKAYIECKVVWTKIAGSSRLILGKIEAISARKETNTLDIKERVAALNRLIFLSYKKKRDKKTWTFGEIGKIHVLTEIDGKVEVKSEII